MHDVVFYIVRVKKQITLHVPSQGPHQQLHFLLARILDYDNYI